jgi:2-polyprenyl-3-methyl-5-hydroxy-6-metoxy-1,4-benzoquinol methylase
MNNQIEAFYDRYWTWRATEDRLYRDAPPLRAVIAVDELQHHGPDSGLVVDIGCGEGTIGRMISDLERDYRVQGVDISREALQYAANGYDRVEHWDAGSDSLLDRWATASVDAAVCLEVFEHLFDPRKVVEEIAQILKPGALFVASVPNFAYWRARIITLRGQFPEEGHHVFNPAEHVHYFTMRSFQMFLEQAGFSLLGLRGAWFDPPRILRRRAMHRFAERRPDLFARQLVATARAPANAR